MKIIAGQLKGQIFAAPSGFRTHPMGDRVRAGLFNVLGDVEGLQILDAFAGSGALGFEALSRGARQILAIEVDRRAQDTINKNATKLGFTTDQYHLVHANAGSWSTNNPQALFDVVFAAPPYDSLQIPLVKKLAQHVKPNGLFVLDWPSNQPLPEIKGLQLVKDKSYGNAQIAFYR